MSSTDTENMENIEFRDQLCTEGIQFVGRMAHTIHSLRTYNLDSPTIRFGLNGMATASQNMLQMATPVTLRFSNKRLLINAFSINPPPGMVEAISRLQHWLRARGVEGFTLIEDPNVADIKALIRALDSLDPHNKNLSEEDALNALEAEGTQAFQLCSCPPQEGIEEKAEDPAMLSIRRYLRLVRGLYRLQEQGPDPAVLQDLNRATQDMVDLLVEDTARVLVLISTPSMLPVRILRPINRMLWALLCGRRLGLQAAELQEISLCALCADLSRYTLPEPLHADNPNPSDRTIQHLQEATLQTIQQLMGIGNLTPTLRRVVTVAFELHLNTDRSGYPVPLSWPELHPFSRLLAVCDAYSNHSAPQAGRSTLDHEAALDHIQNHRGTRYDALMVDEMTDMVTTLFLENHQ